MSPEDFRSSYVSAILESCVVLLLPFFVLCPYVCAECTPPPITLHFEDDQEQCCQLLKMFQIIVVLGRAL